MNKEEIIKMIRDDNTPKELIIAQFETAFKYQMDLQKNIDILHNNQNKLIDEIGEQGKEIERLNNIINELEKDMRETIEIIKNTEYQKIDIDYVIETFDIYCGRLKELKEGK
jgi:predicted  nucleic acid-binding Zn-ribbon protein